MSHPNACPLCGNEQSAVLETRDIAGQEYTLYECAACTGQWWEPFKNPGASWYEHDERYAGRNRDPLLAPTWSHKATCDYFKEPMEVLDVGCGTGNFLAYAKKKGWEGWGIDFDHDAIEVGNRVFGLERMEVADLEEFTRRHPGKRFDLITFFDVLEHVDAPTAFLAGIREQLKKKGYIALSTPYRHAWRWLLPADLPPRHLTRWDETSLERFLTRNGFTIRTVERLPASLTFLILKLRFRYGKWASFGLVGRAKERASVKEGPASQARGKGRIRRFHVLARTKDVLIFGLPALLIWLCLLPTRKRYTDFYVIAQAD